MNLEDFKKYGFIKISNLLNKKKCLELYNHLKEERKWDSSLFLAKEEYLKNPNPQKTNPGKNIQNLISKYDLSFIDKNPDIIKILTNILGKNYEIMLSKFVVAVPDNWMPNYVKKLLKIEAAANINPYIKRKYRDVTYFRGLDYHMDSVDWEGHNNKFITMYIYLNNVDSYMSPLNVIKKSHLNGHTPFPHYIKDFPKKKFLNYSVDNIKFSKFYKEKLIGKTGSCYIWTSNTLHGTAPSKKVSGDFRISLRYLIKKVDKSSSLIDKVLEGTEIKETRNKKIDYKKILK
jgi:hypothetical protein